MQSCDSLTRLRLLVLCCRQKSLLSSLQSSPNASSGQSFLPARPVQHEPQEEGRQQLPQAPCPIKICRDPLPFPRHHHCDASTSVTPSTDRCASAEGSYASAESSYASTECPTTLQGRSSRSEDDRAGAEIYIIASETPCAQHACDEDRAAPSKARTLAIPRPYTFRPSARRMDGLRGAVGEAATS